MFLCNSDNTIMVDIANRVIGVNFDKNDAMWGVCIQDYVRDEADNILCLGDYASKERATEIMVEIKSAVVNGWDFYALPEK